jgi:raffinose synthase
MHCTIFVAAALLLGVLLLACGSDPFQLVDAGVAAAAALSGGAAARSTKQMPTSLDGFGW